MRTEATAASSNEDSDSSQKAQRVPSDPAIDQDDEQDNDAEDEDRTDCVCKQTHHRGLMIQCEMCLTWQHCKCIGIRRKREIPPTYACSACRSGHSIASTSTPLQLPLSQESASASSQVVSVPGSAKMNGKRKDASVSSPASTITTTTNNTANTKATSMATTKAASLAATNTIASVAAAAKATPMASNCAKSAATGATRKRKREIATRKNSAASSSIAANSQKTLDRRDAASACDADDNDVQESVVDGTTTSVVDKHDDDVDVDIDIGDDKDARNREMAQRKKNHRAMLICKMRTFLEQHLWQGEGSECLYQGECMELLARIEGFVENFIE